MSAMDDNSAARDDETMETEASNKDNETPASAPSGGATSSENKEAPEDGSDSSGDDGEWNNSSGDRETPKTSSEATSGGAATENETPASASSGEARSDGAALKGTKGATFAAVAKFTYVKYKKCTQGPNNFVERIPSTRYHSLNVPIHRIPRVKQVLVDNDNTGRTVEESKARSRAKRARQDARTEAKRKQEGKPSKRKKKGGKTPYILTYPAEQRGSDSRTTTMGNWKRIAAEMALRIMEGQLAKEYLPLSVW